MSQSIRDYNTVGLRGEGNLGQFFDFYVNNTFYLLAPEYYYQFYSIYLNRCIAAYDGWIGGFHNKAVGFVPQRMLQSVATGLNNMLFAHGIDFSGRQGAYEQSVAWAKKTKLHKALKKCHKFAIAGGTALLKVNRQNKELYVSAHRIDTFFVDIDASGKVTSATIFFDAIQNMNPNSTKSHYGLCEERYFNAERRPCVKTSIYAVTGTLQTEPQSRQVFQAQQQQRRLVNWEQLPRSVKNFIKDNHPDILIGEEQYLPFPRSLGCFLLRFTDDIPQIPNTQLGQPIGDILFTENWQYDQFKQWEKHEVYMARARALISEEMWNRDDPDFNNSALSEMFYQKVSTVNGEQDKVTQLQFMLRGAEAKIFKENIIKDIAFKLNISASSVASFLSEGAGARTATEIIGERTKSDTWIKSQISLNAPEINEMLKEICLYYNREPVEIVLKAEDQSPFIEKLKTNSDVFAAGNMSPERFVRDTYRNLSQAEQADEIQYLKDTRDEKKAFNAATMTAWGANSQEKVGN